MKRRYQTWDEHMMESLQDPKEAAHYLNAAAQENDPALMLIALSDVARARGLSKTAKEASVSRMGLYKIFSKTGNPEFRTFLRVLRAAGMQLEFKPA
jgi:probable addiction module antidote protein